MVPFVELCCSQLGVNQESYLQVWLWDDIMLALVKKELLFIVTCGLARFLLPEEEGNESELKELQRTQGQTLQHRVAGLSAAEGSRIYI